MNPYLGDWNLDPPDDPPETEDPEDFQEPDEPYDNPREADYAAARWAWDRLGGP